MGKKQRIIFIVLISFVVLLLAFAGFMLYKNYNDGIKLKNSEKELESCKSAIESEIEEKNQLDQNNSELNSQYSSLLEDNSSLKDENNALAEENSALKEQNSSLNKKITELSKKKKQVNDGSKVCYLTFDDGPSDNTLKNLETLDKYNAKATFFVVGTGKLQYLNNITAAGHAVGLHSGTHVYSSIYSSTDAYFADLKSVSDKVYAAVGIKSNIMRFPGGSSNKVSAQYKSGIMTELAAAVQDNGYTYFDWNVTSGDANSTPLSAQAIANNVIKGANGKNSICVLMHDSAAKTATVAALPKILDGLSDMGFSFKALDATCYGFHQTINN